MDNGMGEGQQGCATSCRGQSKSAELHQHLDTQMLKIAHLQGV